MIVNQKDLAALRPVEPYESTKRSLFGVSHGQSEAGYDVRVRQSVRFRPRLFGLLPFVSVDGGPWRLTRFALASTVEQFNMPDDLVGVVHDKSTWARSALSVFNTVIEPGFVGGLTLELVFHGRKPLDLEPGAGVAQVLFHELMTPAQYAGKYQGQGSAPTAARFTGRPYWDNH